MFSTSCFLGGQTFSLTSKKAECSRSSTSRLPMTAMTMMMVHGLKRWQKASFFGGLLVVVGLKNPKSSLDYEAACWLFLRKTWQQKKRCQQYQLNQIEAVNCCCCCTLCWWSTRSDSLNHWKYFRFQNEWNSNSRAKAFATVNQRKKENNSLNLKRCKRSACANILKPSFLKLLMKKRGSPKKNKYYYDLCICKALFSFWFSWNIFLIFYFYFCNEGAIRWWWLTDLYVWNAQFQIHLVVFGEVFLGPSSTLSFSLLWCDKNTLVINCNSNSIDTTRHYSASSLPVLNWNHIFCLNKSYFPFQTETEDNR